MIKLMDDAPISPAADLPSEENLRNDLKSLRYITTLLLVSLVCLAMGLTMFLYRQARGLNRQVAEAKRSIDDYNSNAAPRIQWFVGNLQAFARTNPDINPVLAKYNLLPAPSPVAPSARPVAPAPAPAPKK